ncbi:MAG: 5-oxoprolinase subunit PxpB [Telmatospirillum sp.]|nr:5-oxoprolinase subunit PxpB [Telmatospirillum sp.]
MDDAKTAPQISLIGTSGLLFEAPGAFDLANQRRIWALARSAATLDWVAEAIPGMTNLLLVFRAPPQDVAAVEGNLRELWDKGAGDAGRGERFEFDVDYGGEGGPDLDFMAEQTGLSRSDVVEIHAGRDYTVFALGSHPGYAYLGTVDPRLFIPRRKVPRISIPAGAVSIGGWQTGASASDGPSGWHTIGHTEARFFDPQSAVPALLAPGDTIRFRISRILA